jgi:hypothetical protein
MKTRGQRTRLLAGMVLLAVTVTLAVRTGLGVRSGARASPQQAETPARANAAPTQALPPAARLRIRVAEGQGETDALLDPTAAAWKRAAPTAILLNRTPRIFPTEPAQDRPIPACQVLALHSSGQLYFRLHWADQTKNQLEAPPAKTGAGGDANHLYKRPTGETSAFADAAAVMVPDHWTGPRFPSLSMGDKHAPVHLYYWNASRGAAVLTASGRATPQPSGQSFPCRSEHAAGHWTVTAAIPDQPEGYPVAFAIWDGQYSDRDGLKFFSVWYVLTRE